MEIKRDYYLKQLTDAQENHLIKIVTGMWRYLKKMLMVMQYANRQKSIL
ncbi:MAG: hypothetical protein GX685_05360 [Clostridiales bacterium]|nr:hypothetical protein [Clostridiales bacterium]